MAAGENWDCSRYLRELANEELISRQHKREARLINQGGFPMARELSGYDVTRVAVKEHQVRELGNCDYLADGTAVVFYGDLELGKTHLAVGDRSGTQRLPYWPYNALLHGPRTRPHLA